MLVLLASLAAQAAPCDAAEPPAAIAAHADEAVLAWAGLDEEGFRDAAHALDVALPCVSAPLSAGQAAAVHRVHGLRDFLDGDPEAALLAFHAAAIADPGYALPERVAPRGGKLARLVDEAQARRAGPADALEVPEGTVWVDGIDGGSRAEDRPALVQIGAGEAVGWTALLRPGMPFEPPHDALLGLPEAPLEVPAAPRERRGADPLLLAAAGTGAASAGLFGASAALRGRFDRAPSRSLHTATNGAFIASAGMAAVTGGLVTVALARRR